MEYSIQRMDETAVERYYEEIVSLKNIGTATHFDKGDIDGFNRTKITELIEHLKNGRAYVFGAFADASLVGYIWGYPKLFFEEKRMFINSCIISPEFRRQGLGEKLIRTLSEYAKEMLGCTAMFTSVTPSNKTLLAFLDRRGYETERLQMRADL